MPPINPLSSVESMLNTQDISQSVQNQKKIANAYETLKEQQQLQDIQASAAALPFKKFDSYFRALA